MRYIRVKSYYESKWNGTEHLYLGEDQVKAIERFKKDYPQYVGKCILVAETIDSLDDPEYFKVCQRCECVN